MSSKYIQTETPSIESQSEYSSSQETDFEPKNPRSSLPSKKVSKNEEIRTQTLDSTSLMNGEAKHDQEKSVQIPVGVEPRGTLKRTKTKKEVFLNTFFGVPTSDEAQEVPEGYTVVFSGHSKQPSLIKLEKAKDLQNDQELEKYAAEEHIRPGSKLPACAGREKIKDAFGEGVYLYFDFVIFLGVANLIFFLITLVNVIPHFIYDGFQYTNQITEIRYNFYIVTYSAKIYWYWLMSNIALCVGWFLLGPILAKRISLHFKRFGYYDHQDKYNLKDLDIIKDKKGRPKNPNGLSVGRFILSYFFFVLVVVASGLVTVGFVITQEDFGSIVASLIVSAFLFVINFLSRKLCLLLTILENHRTWTGFKYHHLLKFYLWRILNVSLIFLTRFLVSRGYLVNWPIYSWIGTPTQQNSCTLGDLGDQFLFIFVFVYISSIGDLLYGKIYFCLCSCRKQTGPKLETGRPPFDIAEEYLELMYRQYALYLGVPIFPFAALFAAFSNFFTYAVNKYLLLRVCRTPPRLRGSMKNLLVFSLFVTCIVAVGIYPFGVAWILAGYDLKNQCPNVLWS